MSIAEALIAATELPPDSTMDDANSLGMSFVCMCCLPEVRMLMTWFDLIKHFNDEYCIFEITERAKELRKSDVTLIFDHDVVEQTKPLAIHTGLRRDSNDKSDPPGVDKWVKKCSCADCAAGLLFSNHQCEQCALYGSDQFFFCLGKLDAHLRARHAYIREVKCE
ncbi:hypothetical protein DFH11DRAFT_304533 [Phellopilus nigrolimitatus]|nr:hypothetical protein DFH11DRAFT_304533 [Phellopilus nigrolimitatus]